MLWKITDLLITKSPELIVGGAKTWGRKKQNKAWDEEGSQLHHAETLQIDILEINLKNFTIISGLETLLKSTKLIKSSYAAFSY